jgi:lysozyme family protein
MTAQPDFSRIPPDAFQWAFAFTLPWEKGRSDNPADHGGRTKDGVTQMTYDAYRRSKGLPKRDVFEMADPERDDVYRRWYWDAVMGDDLAKSHLGLAVAVFDTAVNSGVRRASQRLQTVAGMQWESRDGVVGKVTLACVRIRLMKVTKTLMLGAYLDLRRGHYATILRNDPSQRVFRNGWKNRLNALGQYVGLPDPIWED